MPSLALGLGLHKGGLPLRLQALINKAQPKLLLMASKADGTSPLTGNQSPWVDKANKVGKNLFDTAIANKDNKYINSSGNEITSSSWWASGFTKIIPNTQYVFNNLFNSTVAYVAFYDLNKQFISSVQNSIVVSNFGVFTTPANSVYVRFSSPQSITPIETFQLELGTTATAYEPYAKNNAALYNFAGTATSGWNGTPRYIALDGIDDHMRLANSPSLDITTAPLTITVTNRPSVTATSGWLQCRNNADVASVQYGVYRDATAKTLALYLNGTAIKTVSVADAEWREVMFHWDGANVTAERNGVPQGSPVAFTGPLVSAPNMRLGARSASTDGLTHTAFAKADLGNIGVYTGPLDDVRKLSKEISKTYVTWGV